MFLFLVTDWCSLWLLDKLVTDWESATFFHGPIHTREEKQSNASQGGPKVRLWYINYTVCNTRHHLYQCSSSLYIRTLFAWRIYKCTVYIAHKNIKGGN